MTLPQALLQVAVSTAVTMCHCPLPPVPSRDRAGFAPDKHHDRDAPPTATPVHLLVTGPALRWSPATYWSRPLREDVTVVMQGFPPPQQQRVTLDNWQH